MQGGRMGWHDGGFETEVVYAPLAHLCADCIVPSSTDHPKDVKTAKTHLVLRSRVGIEG